MLNMPSDNQIFGCIALVFAIGLGLGLFLAWVF